MRFDHIWTDIDDTVTYTNISAVLCVDVQTAATYVIQIPIQLFPTSSLCDNLPQNEKQMNKYTNECAIKIVDNFKIPCVRLCSKCVSIGIDDDGDDEVFDQIQIS